MKKIKVVLMLVVTVLFVSGLFTQQVKAETEGEWEYTISNGAVTITGHTGASTVWEIPEKIGEMKVTAIAQSIFKGNQSIEELVIPKYITSVGNYSFENCTSLSKMTFNAVHCNDMDASIVFKGCNSIETVIIGKNVEYLPWGAFTETDITSIEIPDSVEEIGPYAFSKCDKLMNVTLGKKVLVIGERAFGDCTALEDITTSEKITTLGPSVFINCSSLEEIILPVTVVNLKNHMFDGCSSLEKIRYISSKKFNLNDTFFLDSETSAVLYCIKGSVVDKYAQFFDIDAKYILKTPSIKLAGEKKSIKVSWKKIAGATGYDVYRSTKKNGSYNLITTIKGIKNVTFTDTDIESGKKYFYKVVAVNGKDNFMNSGYSAKKSIVVE